MENETSLEPQNPAFLVGAVMGSTGINRIFHDDWMNNNLPDKSVQLLIADPPYFEVKGSFDFVWKSFEDYLIDVEKWAVECKRLLADNGTLLWYGDAKNIAYSQIIIDKYFNLLNNLVWENTNDHKQQIRFNPDLRTFAPCTERILMYSVGDDYHDNVRLSIKYIQDYLATITTRNELAEILLQTGNCRNAESAKQNANNILSQKSAKPQMITKSQYNLLPNRNKKEYEELRKEYEELRKEYEELRRPFNNERFYGDVIRLPNYETANYDHDTIKPEKLTRIFIQTCSRPNDLVFVPFSGSGTEVAMAIKEGRNAIGFDIEEKYVEMGNKRIDSIKAQPSLFAVS